MPSSPALLTATTITRPQMRQWLTECRAATLQLFATVDAATFCAQAHPDFSPIGWHLGHIGFTEALWILEHCAGHAPQPATYRRLYAADSLPKHERQTLPSLAETQHYLETIRQQVFAYLETAPLDEQARLWCWLLQHESQHNETISFILAQLRQPAVPVPPIAPTTVAPTPMVRIPAGPVRVGDDSVWAIDNERPPQTYHLAEFWLDVHPVTCGQYAQFMAAAGYTEARWWTPEGWAWRTAHDITAPRYWPQTADWARHPVCGVSWYEAAACAHFFGKRLPTEWEWEKAARWYAPSLPSDAATLNINHRLGQTRAIAPPTPDPICTDLLGNVWEWTASWFAGQPGFEAYPYRGYSEAYFDGTHRVLRGGSWATRPWALRVSFRNWYHPHVREFLAGFRCASDTPG